MSEKIIIVKQGNAVSNGFGLACGCCLFVLLLLMSPFLFAIIAPALFRAGEAAEKAKQDETLIERPSPIESPSQSSDGLTEQSGSVAESSPAIDLQEKALFDSANRVYAGMPMDAAIKCMGSEGVTTNRSRVNSTTIEKRYWQVNASRIEITFKNAEVSEINW
jgi:hypothetical protein